MFCKYSDVNLKHFRMEKDLPREIFNFRNNFYRSKSNGINSSRTEKGH